MKNSRQYSPKVQKLFRLLRREYGKTQKVTFDEPMDAVVYATISENMIRSAAQSALRKLQNHFVDWNDLRVSRPDEIVEVLGKDDDESRAMVSALTQTLYSIFNKYDVVSLEALTQMGKRPAKQAIAKMDSVSRFAANYVMLTSLHGHAVPLTPRMIEYLRVEQLVHPDATEDEIEGFLIRQISASKAYEFYALLRRESEKGAIRAKRKHKALDKAAPRAPKSGKKRKKKAVRKKK